MGWLFVALSILAIVACFTFFINFAIMSSGTKDEASQARLDRMGKNFVGQMFFVLITLIGLLIGVVVISSLMRYKP